MILRKTSWQSSYSSFLFSIYLSSVQNSFLCPYFRNDLRKIRLQKPQAKELVKGWIRFIQSWNIKSLSPLQKTSNILSTSCEQLTHWKGSGCWEGLGAGGEGDDRGWNGWMASPTQWTWVWVDSRSCWWTGRPGVLRFMGSQRVGHDWATELNILSM